MTSGSTARLFRRVLAVLVLAATAALATGAQGAPRKESLTAHTGEDGKVSVEAPPARWWLHGRRLDQVRVDQAA